MEEEILEIQAAVREAILTRDTDFFESLISDGLIFTTPQGKQISKREDIDQYKSGDLTVRRFDITGQKVRIYGTTALVWFKAHIEGQFKLWAFSTPFQFTRVYAKIGPDWKMVAGHSSEIGNGG